MRLMINVRRFRLTSIASTRPTLGTCSSTSTATAINCCDCSGADVAPDTQVAQWLVDNGGWPKEADGKTYAVMPFNGLAHTTALDCIFWQVLSAKEGFEFEVIIGNCPYQPVDHCTGEPVGEPVSNFEGEENIVLGTIDASLEGCKGDRAGSGLFDLSDLSTNLLKFNDFIGIRPTAVPEPEEGQTASCVWENLGLRISPVTKDLCQTGP